MTGAALEEDEDDAFGVPPTTLGLYGLGRRTGVSLQTEDVGKADAEEACTADAEEFATAPAVARATRLSAN